MYVHIHIQKCSCCTGALGLQNFHSKQVIVFLSAENRCHCGSLGGFSAQIAHVTTSVVAFQVEPQVKCFTLDGWQCEE